MLNPAQRLYTLPQKAVSVLDMATTMKEKIQEALERHLEVYGEDPEVMHHLQSFLQARPLYSAPIPRDKIFERHHDLAKEVEALIQKPLLRRKMEPFNLSTMGLATLMQMPTVQLHGIIKLLSGKLDHQELVPELSASSADIAEALRSIPAAMNHFLSRKVESERKIKRGAVLELGDQGPLKTKSSVASVSTNAMGMDKEKSVPRNGAERRKCFQRDGDKCIVTGSPDPEACHIIPFSWNATSGQQSQTLHHMKTLRIFMRKAEYEDLLLDLGIFGGVHAKTRGSSDKSWNMVSLSPQLHDWWGRAYWAFQVFNREEVEGIPEEGAKEVEGDKKRVEKVVLQFHWMQIPVDRQKRAMPSEGVVWGEASQLHTKLQQNERAAHNCSWHWPIRSGDLFEVFLEPEDAAKFVRMMDLQWSIINIVALAGAAGDPEFLVQKDEDPEEGGAKEEVDMGSLMESVASWARSVAPGRPGDEPETREP